MVAGNLKLRMDGMFDQIAKVIRENNLELLQGYLNNHIEFFLQPGPAENKEDSLLHIAIQNNNVTLLTAIVMHLKTIGKLNAATELVNQSGQTILHAAAEYLDFKHFQKLIKDLGAEITARVIRRVDNAMLLPLHYAFNKGLEFLNFSNESGDYCDQQYQQRISCFVYLLEKIKYIPYKNVSETIDEKELLSSIPESKEDEALRHHLILACRTVNACRTIIQASPAHPSMNNYSKTAQDEIEHRYEEAHSPDSLGDAKSDLRSKVQRIVKSRIGNSEQFSDLFQFKAIFKQRAMQRELSFKRPISVERFRIAGHVPGTPGRAHQFMVIGRPEGSSNDYRTWKGAVIADAHFGLVFQAKDIPLYFMDYYFYVENILSSEETPHQTYHIPIFYNAVCHQFEPYDPDKNDLDLDVGEDITVPGEQSHDEFGMGNSKLSPHSMSQGSQREGIPREDAIPSPVSQSATSDGTRQAETSRHRESSSKVDASSLTLGFIQQPPPPSSPTSSKDMTQGKSDPDSPNHTSGGCCIIL